jgi:hypothetical protein
MPFVTTALAGGGIVAGVGGMASSLYGSHVQAEAAKSAAQLEAESRDKSLAFQEKVYEENKARQAPWLKAGTGAIDTLSGLISKPGEGLLTPFTDKFTAPTGLTEQNDPGFQARLKMGTDALQNSAAARGGLTTGGTAKDLTQFSQDYASNEYSNVYGRAVQQYQQAYNIFRNNQTDTYNRLAGVAGTGQVSAQNLGGAGQNAAGNVSNINMTASSNIGRDLQNAAYQTASGYAGATNAFSGMMSNLSGLEMLKKLLAQQQGSAAAGDTIGY